MIFGEKDKPRLRSSLKHIHPFILRQRRGRHSGPETARTSAKSGLPVAQHNPKPGLLEVMVTGESQLDAFFIHDPEGGTVRE